jgi:alanyl-tRNA synthetase
MAHQMSQEQARSLGAMAGFGEKYGDVVRVVSVGDWAHELCGGTHAQRSGQVGLVTFLSEGSIGAGVRRVEALVGTDAYRFLAREHLLVSQLAEALKARPDELPERVDSVLTRLKDAERELTKIKRAQLTANLDGVIGTGNDVGRYRLWTFTAPEGTSAGDLRELVLRGRGNANPALNVAFIGASVDEGKVALVAAVNDSALKSGLGANDVLQAALPAVDGRGGGKGDVAQGGGTRADGIDAAFTAVSEFLATR